MSEALVFFEGLGLGASLIMAIGAQNSYVLAQGLRRSHVFAVALTCSLSDAILITIGVAGVGQLVASNPTLLNVATWGGALFLFIYGALSFKAALKPDVLRAEDVSRTSLYKTVMMVLALSFLNPHAVLDTVVLLGSISGRYSVDNKLAFGVGAVLSSFLWFFGLAYGARWLRPLLQKPISWQILDALIGAIMFAIGLSLIM